MKDKITTIFQKAAYSPEPELALAVWSSVIAQERKQTRLKLWAFGFTGLASLTGLVPAFKILFTDLSQSGFYEYFSLLFSDTGSVVTYWKEFSFSLAEALPVISTILTLSLLFVCFLSLKYLMKQIIRSQLTFNAAL
ncbi:hypothetical protein HY311_00710 [Candidatus Nomurabacteria bacterium]|nr:hypothetical protein [Candidatus Nomurabacteria bacterium]